MLRIVQTRILTLRGQASADLRTRSTGSKPPAATPDSLDALVGGLGTAAIARAALAQPDHATALLAEIDAHPGSRDNENYPSLLPALVRTALATDNPQLAHQLTTGVQPRTPYARARPHHRHRRARRSQRRPPSSRRTGTPTPRKRWQAFGVIPEQAFALLGHGRCLLALDDPTATQPLHQARDLFTRLQAAPYIAECDTLLAQAAERAS